MSVLEALLSGKQTGLLPDGTAVKEIRYAWKNIAELIVPTQ